MASENAVKLESVGHFPREVVPVGVFQCHFEGQNKKEFSLRTVFLLVDSVE